MKSFAREGDSAARRRSMEPRPGLPTEPGPVGLTWAWAGEVVAVCGSLDMGVTLP